MGLNEKLALYSFDILLSLNFHPSGGSLSSKDLKETDVPCSIHGIADVKLATNFSNHKKEH